MPRDAMPTAQAFEKLGAFYLGRVVEPGSEQAGPELLLYDAKDLTTHAVCVGMTGSGKTGLCLALLEEAALDGIPAIAIDPKGDLGNLLLTFPGLEAGDFRPWIDEAEAVRRGTSPDDYAAQVAARWRDGLAGWGQDGDRIARLKAAADFAVYTPGSSAGLPLSVLRTFAAPPAALIDDGDAFRERVGAATSGILALLGIDADPVQSREHVLVANLLDHAWRAGRDLDLATLVAEIQSPPLERVGVMDLEAFYPAKDRAALAMRLNGLLASPGFAPWLEGEPLDVARLLWTESGRPRVSIVSIAHLADAERMFLVTLLLTEVVAWMRRQAGTPSLRALLYMDEVFGFFPPTANPPSKTPMLTLLKQARAYGLGVVLATQNPVDLDYKGLANAGTWFLGRLQTERDKLRVLDGLEGASAASGTRLDRQAIDATLSGLRSRVFLMHNVHEDAPVLFETRWVMSYLRGPLTRVELQRLVDPLRPSPAAAVAPAPPQARRTVEMASAARARPVLEPNVPQVILSATAPAREGERLAYRPALLATADLHFVDRASNVDEWSSVTSLAPLGESAKGDVWNDAIVSERPPETASAPLDDASFAAVPPEAARAKSYASWGKRLVTHLFRTQALERWQCKALDLVSEPGESEGAFRVRIREAGRARRDAELEKLRARYAPKVATLQNQVRQAEQRLSREQSQVTQQSVQTAISVGATVLGALLGRKAMSTSTLGRATTAARGAGRAAREVEDVSRARESLATAQARLAELEREFEAEVSSLQQGTTTEEYPIERLAIGPRKSDLSVHEVSLAWTPWWVDPTGATRPAFG